MACRNRMLQQLSRVGVRNLPVVRFYSSSDTSGWFVQLMDRFWKFLAKYGFSDPLPLAASASASLPSKPGISSTSFNRNVWIGAACVCKVDWVPLLSANIHFLLYFQFWIIPFIFLYIIVVYYILTCYLIYSYCILQIATGGNSSILSQSTAKYSTANEATIECRPWKLHKLDQGPPQHAVITRDDALLYYRQMQMIRRMETAANAMYKEKLIRGFCHLYSGQVCF